MPFQAAPFVLATAGVGGIGAGAWHVLTGNSCDSWETCGGRRKSTWLSERTGSEIMSSLYHADPNSARHSNIEGDDNHTGLSPRLSHVVETMAGTQRKGDIPNWRAQRRLEVANRRPVKADEVSLAEGLRSAFAHENRGPTEAQAAAIRAEKEHFEQREQEKRQRIEAEQARRAELLTLDRQERERRAQLALEARGAEARAGDKSMGNFLQLDLRNEKQRVAAEVREREQRAREKVLQAHQVRQLPKDYSPRLSSQRTDRMRMSSSCPFTPARQSGLACWDSSPADIVEVRRCCACAIRGRAGWPRRTRIAPRAAGQSICSENALCARAAGGSMLTRASQIVDDSRTIGLCSQNLAGPARPSGSPLLARAWRTVTR